MRRGSEKCTAIAKPISTDGFVMLLMVIWEHSWFFGSLLVLFCLLLVGRLKTINPNGVSL